MSDFLTDTLTEWGQLESLAEDAFSSIVDAVEGSVLKGSPITGSKGQPVKSGKLLRSWITKRTGRRLASIETDNDYAIFVENQAHGAEYDAGGGGPHSLRRTVARFAPLAEDAVKGAFS